MTGIICIDKPADITSFSAVSRLRGMTGEKKAGHTGTLDPMATGVLPVMLGGATRFLDYLPESDKGYRAGFRLGMTTDTLDITGKVLSVSEVSCTEADVLGILPSFRGEIEQFPPMFSAKSVDGKRLYELARKGIEVERTPVKINIKGLELSGFENGEYTIDVLCSKGTYVRSLIDDIGRALGCGAVMTSLRRTLASGFTLDDCRTLDYLQSLKDGGEGFGGVLIALEQVYGDYRRVNVSPAQATRFSNGGALALDRIKGAPQNGVCTVYSPTGEFLGLGEVGKEELKVLRLLTNRN